jgi:hypothetical protein
MGLLSGIEASVKTNGNSHSFRERQSLGVPRYLTQSPFPIVFHAEFGQVRSRFGNGQNRDAGIFKVNDPSRDEPGVEIYLHNLGLLI